jgi:hypothetical protein
LLSDPNWGQILPMSLSRVIMFAISTISLAVVVAWSAPDGPDSPRARAAVWLRAHGHPDMARVVEPASLDALPTPVIPTLP